jgi:hypothetical protein
MPSLSINFNPAVGPLLQLTVFPPGYKPPGAGQSSPSSPVNIVQYMALIDTGASHTSISKKVITALNLNPSGKQPVSGLHGPQPTKLYQFQIGLIFPQSQAATGAISAQLSLTPVIGPEFIPPGGFDVLLGRDVICRGHFSMSFDGHATLSL